MKEHLYKLFVVCFLILLNVWLMSGPILLIEICANGIDDDGDGLIDCYDPDCGCTKVCDHQYFKVCPLDCIRPFPDTPVLVKLEWESVDTLWHEYSLPVTGDIDGDGWPDIIGKKGPFNHDVFNLLDSGFVIYNAQNGATKYRMNDAPIINYTNPTIALADLDKDGKSEMVFLSSSLSNNRNGGQVYCYEWSAGKVQLKWISDSSLYTTAHPLGTSSPVSFADMNHDGNAEVIVSNYIFNGLDGHLMAKGDTSANFGRIHNWDSFHDVYFPVVADILPDGFCPDCQGMELVIGNEVYSVTFDNRIPIHQRIKREVQLPNGTDGFTSVCDFDRDGDLDILYSSTSFQDSVIRLTVWDGQTPVRLTSDYTLKRTVPFNARFMGLPILRDLDGDGQVEVLLNSPLLYQVLDWEGGNWKVILSMPTTDKSGLTGSTAFDFNQDGRYEIVYRDETHLNIIDALSGKVLFKTPCTSGTFVEYPVIADIDKDGEAEILCGCGKQLRAYGSAGAPWPLTRSIWNQELFYNVNINDDGTVPIHQQEHHIVADSVLLNNYLMPYAYDQLPAIDIWIDTLIFKCSDSLNRVFIRVCNAGDKPINPNTPISVYSENPLTQPSPRLLTAVVARRIEVDSCIDFILNISDTTVNSLYFVANAPGPLKAPFRLENFPYTPFIECDYLNNIDSVFRPDTYNRLNLGPDISACTLDSIPILPDNKYKQYYWQDGSTDSMLWVNQPGLYWLEVTDECGRKSRDSILITILPPPMLDIGRDSIVCPGEILFLQADSFDEFQWRPKGIFDCDTCAQVYARIDSTTLITLEARTEEGCINRDTISVYTFPRETSTDSLPLCAGDTLVVHDSMISRPGIYSFHLPDQHGCDSIARLHIWLTSGSIQDTQIYICPGDSAFIFDNWEKKTGTYQMRFSNSNQCDSILLVDLFETNPLTLDIRYDAPCPEVDSTLVYLLPQGGKGPITILWDGLQDDIERKCAKGIHQIELIDSIGCSRLFRYEIVGARPPLYSIESVDASCPGLEDGQIVFNSALQLEFDLEDSEHQSLSPPYDSLSPGTYFMVIIDSLGCAWRDTIEIAGADSLILSIRPDTTIFKGDEVLLYSSAFGQGGGRFSWQPSFDLICPACRQTEASPTSTTTYTVTFTDDNGCQITRAVTIKVIDGAKVFIPNVFTPNGDGLNDGFTVFGSKRVEEILELNIYDRWGEWIFHTASILPNRIELGWDGRFQGKNMQPGVYVYTTKVRFKSGVIRDYYGDVTLVR